MTDRVWNSLAFGTLGPVNDNGVVQTGQVSIGGIEVQDARPMIGLFGLASNPPTGSNVVMLFQGGDRSKGISIGVNHQGSRPTGQLPGEATLFNAFGMSVKLAQAGMTMDGNDMPLTVKRGPASVTMDASGNVTLAAGGTTLVMDAGGNITATAPIFNVVGVLQVNGVVVEVP